MIVTSRIAVADRVRFPEGSAALRLEPFNDDQIRAWVEIWNRVNASAFGQGTDPPDWIQTSSSPIANLPASLCCS